MGRTRNSLLLAAAFILLATAAPGYAGVNRWTSNGPEGAYITAVVFDPLDPQTVYAASDGGGLYRSTTGGAEWVPIGEDIAEGAITALAVDPTDTPMFYVGTASGRVFRSQDRGTRWSEVDKPASGAISGFAIDSARPRVYIATATGVQISRDGGQSWDAIPQLARGADSIAVANNGTVYASLSGTLSGTVWTARRCM